MKQQILKKAMHGHIPSGSMVVKSDENGKQELHNQKESYC